MADVKGADQYEGLTAEQLLKQFQKDYGKEIGSMGGPLTNRTRIPFGFFPLDLATGGGLPRGRVTTIYGPESSNKTNAVFKAIRNNQIMYPDEINAFVDIETSYDQDWAQKMGVNTDKLVVLQPGYAEEAIDLVEGLLYTKNIGIVAIDSLAALVTTQEAGSSAEKANVGGAGLAVGKLCRKTGLALREAEKAGRSPTVIYINQTRFKIGVMYGDPETMPGGNMPRFQSSLWLRFYGTNLKDPKISKDMPIAKDVSFVVKKWKVPIFSINGKYTMTTVPHKGLKVGDCDDFNTVKAYLQKLDAFNKGEKGKGWSILGEEYDTQDDFKELLYNDPVFGNEVRNAIISNILSGDNMSSAEGEVADEDEEA